MNKTMILGLLAALGLGLSMGYWAARERAPAPPEHKPLYYRHPMNPKVTSPTPAKDEMGMDYLPVFAEESTAKPERKGKILYYRNPMGAADTSPVPKKDEMGMDYIPVYEGEALASRQINISPEKIQKLGVKTAKAEPRLLLRTIRALGSIQVDERRVHSVTTKFEGWIHKLDVNATGLAVKRGQILLEAYSPDLLTTQQDYLIALQGAKAMQQASQQARETAEQLADNALQRLRYWDIGPEQLERLKRQEKPQAIVPISSPVSGVVLEKPAVEGMRFMPGEMLFRIADLSTVWLLADVFEQDLGWVSLGQAVSVHINAYPTQTFKGRVNFIYPTVSTETRTAKVRIELPNHSGLLKPGIYGSVSLASAEQPQTRLAVPESAVLDSGVRQVVLVNLGQGIFEPRRVKLGQQADGYIEVLEGLAAGENVVTSANFLIDAESNLKSALEGFEAPPPPSPESGETMPEHRHEGH